MKKINYAIHFGVLFLLFLLFSTCEKEANIQLPQEEEKLTVLCNFTPNEPFSIQLSKSSPLFPKKEINTYFVGDAMVQICKGSQESEKLPANSSSSDANAKFTSSEIIPKVREYYTLKITLDGLDPITATSSIPEPIQIEHSAAGAVTSLTSDMASLYHDYKVKLSMQFQDPAGEKNYYQINFYQELSNSISLQDTIVQISPNSGFDLIDESLIESFNVIDGGILFNDLTFDGEFNDLLFEPIFRYNRSTSMPKGVIIELRTVSEEYYKYYTSVYRQVRNNYQNTDGSTFNGSLPFSDPVKVFSNIENGFGIFAGYNKNSVKIPIEL